MSLLSDLFPADEAAALESALDDGRLAMVRDDDLRAELDAIGDDHFAAYWAQSPSACVMRDYRAGRVVEIRA